MKKPSLTRVNFLLYSLLLIITPFLMLMNFLQNAIGQLSRAGFTISGIKIPYLLLLAIAFLLVIFVLNIKKMNRLRWFTLVIILCLFMIGQLTSDYYFGHHFYDLQNNWHYFAYGIFAFLAYRRFSIKDRPFYRISWMIFIYAFAISCFDEFIQVYISNRIFDISDVAKDLWGSMIGQVIVFFLVRQGADIPDKSFKCTKALDYFKKPFPVLSLQFIIAYTLLFIGSLLTEDEYLFSVALIVIPIALVSFLLILACRQKILRWAILIILAGMGIYALANSFFSEPNVKYSTSGLSLNGMPLPYFDYMIFPDGSFRPVDKKVKFNNRDKQKIESLNPDILVIGTGDDGAGGKGWNDQETMELIYNDKQNKVFQIIKLKNQDACKTFNRLIKEGKNTLFIIHNN